VPGGPRHRPLEDAQEILDLVWASLPPAHRCLLESLGASRRRAVHMPLGREVGQYRRSANLRALPSAARRRLDGAPAVWVKDLRIVPVNEAHPQLAGLDPASREQVIARLAWHERGHALSVERCSPDDVVHGN
jgi:hypothetical protein